jgi:hypothetical protein
VFASRRPLGWSPLAGGKWAHQERSSPQGRQESGQDQDTRTPVRVLYVGGGGRSGSTLLDLLLGQLPGFFSAGEVREIWRALYLEDRHCGCGTPLRECSFWRAVGAEAFGGWQRLNSNEMLRLRYRFDRGWALPSLMAPRFSQRTGGLLERYVSALNRLYWGIREVSGAHIVLDSSNMPSHGFLLRRAAGIDVRLVHLVRDSRGVAYSWQKRVQQPNMEDEPRFLPQYGLVASSVRWVGYNAATETLQAFGVPYRRLRYEDLLIDPKARVREVAGHAGVEVSDESFGFLNEGQAELGPNHTVDGNPMRFATGPVTLRLDDRWSERMPGADRRMITAMTLPMLRRYGYPIR